MHDPQPVRRIQRIQNLARILHRPLDRQRPLEGLAFDILHDEVIRPHIVQRADMRMIQRCHGFGFPVKALRELLFRDFESDSAVEPRIARLVDIALAARADGRKDLLRNNPRSGSRLLLQGNESVAELVGLAL